MNVTIFQSESHDPSKFAYELDPTGDPGVLKVTNNSTGPIYAFNPDSQALRRRTINSTKYTTFDSKETAAEIHPNGAISGEAIVYFRHENGSWKLVEL